MQIVFEGTPTAKMAAMPSARDAKCFAPNVELIARSFRLMHGTGPVPSCARHLAVYEKGSMFVNDQARPRIPSGRGRLNAVRGAQMPPRTLSSKRLPQLRKVLPRVIIGNARSVIWGDEAPLRLGPDLLLRLCLTGLLTRSYSFRNARYLNRFCCLRQGGGSLTWVDISRTWHDTGVTNCTLCGRLIPRRLWVADVGGSSVGFCGADCERLYREYWLPKHGRAVQQESSADAE